MANLDTNLFCSSDCYRFDTFMTHRIYQILRIWIDLHTFVTCDQGIEPQKFLVTELSSPTDNVTLAQLLRCDGAQQIKILALDKIFEYM